MPSSKSKVINSRHRKKIDVLNFQSLHHFVTLPSWQSRTHAHEDVNAHALWRWRAFFLWWMCVCLGLIFHRLFSQASWDFSPIVKKGKIPYNRWDQQFFFCRFPVASGAVLLTAGGTGEGFEKLQRENSIFGDKGAVWGCVEGLGKIEPFLERFSRRW